MISLFQLKPRPQERTCLIGTTGSGKTTMARWLLNYYPYVVIFDPKDEIRWEGYKRFTTLRDLAGAKEPKLIYAPIASELRDEDFHEAFFRWIYERKNTLLYVDEVYAIAYRQDIPDSYHACLTRGRTRNISVISATQRPKDIHPVILSENENFFIYRLQLSQDKEAIRKTIGLDEDLISKLKKREFYHWTIDGANGPFKLHLNGDKK